MWWRHLLWGLWNGMTAWVVLIAHAFGAWNRQPIFDATRTSNWYALGFLIGAGAWSGSTRAPRGQGRTRGRA